MKDKTLAEYIISICKKHSEFDEFKKKLVDEGAELSEASLDQIFTLVGGQKQHSVNQKPAVFLEEV